MRSRKIVKKGMGSDGDIDIPNANANDERMVGGRMVVYKPWLCL